MAAACKTLNKLIRYCGFGFAPKMSWLRPRVSTTQGVQWRQEADETRNKRLQHLRADPQEATSMAEPPEIQQGHQTYSAQARPE